MLLWLGFAGTHLVLSSLPVRQRIVARVGENAFRGLYSLVAFAFFVPLVGTFFAHKHAGRWLWLVERGAGLHWAMYVGMGLAFVMLVASLVRRSEEHTSELQSRLHLVCRLLLEKKKND